MSDPPMILCVPKKCRKIYVDRINPWKIQHLGEDKLNNERNSGKRPAINEGRWKPKTFKKNWNDQGAGFSGTLIERGRKTTKTAEIEQTIQKLGESSDVNAYNTRFDFGRDTFR